MSYDFKVHLLAQSHYVLQQNLYQFLAKGLAVTQFCKVRIYQLVLLLNVMRPEVSDQLMREEALAQEHGVLSEDRTKALLELVYVRLHYARVLEVLMQFACRR